jgi:hypothetical protein
VTADTKQAGLRPGIRILIAFFSLKLVWDLWTVWQTWPDFSRPKLGIAIVLPILIAGMVRRRGWALNLAGVTCMFWIAFLVARMIAPLLAVEPVQTPFPWSNLLAIPAVFYVLQNLDSDEEKSDRG